MKHDLNVKTGIIEDELHLEHILFIIDADLKGLLPINGPEIAENMVKKLLTSLSMEKLGNFEIFSATDLRAPGFSFLQPITTSHISGHYFEKPGQLPHIHIDIYSCKKFPYKDSILIIDQYLKLDNWFADVIFREMKKNRELIELSGNGPMIHQV